MPDLETFIANEIRTAGGQITFERYMELALYHPRWGYYSNRPPIGKDGDFFTNVSVGPLFGRILARQFLKYRNDLGNPPDFQIVEFGGHKGQLRDDVLREAPDLKYRVIEAGDPLPDQLCGCVFSNEFLDAMPVHRIRAVGGRWQEVYVVNREGPNGPFAEATGPLSTPRLARIYDDQPEPRHDGFTVEVNFRALDWMLEIAHRLTKGYVITIDYGHGLTSCYTPHQKEGTLLCYYRHTENKDPFARVGQQDITAHVAFAPLIHNGEKNQLQTISFSDQSQFLLEAGRELFEEIATTNAGKWSSERNQIHQLTHPALMGRTFKVLVQRKI